MWTKYFALFLLFAIVASSDTSTERKCVDGQRYYDGCNTVFCAGGHAAQTLMACSEQDPITGEYVPTKVLPAPEGFWED